MLFLQEVYKYKILFGIGLILLNTKNRDPLKCQVPVKISFQI
jgi:hypothetical protein